MRKTDSSGEGEEDDGGVDDTRIALMIVKIHSHVSTVHMTVLKKKNYDPVLSK